MKNQSGKTGSVPNDVTSAEPAFDYKELSQNYEKIDSLTKRLVLAVSSKASTVPLKNPPSQEMYYKASAKYFSEILSNPAKLVENQVKYYKSTLEAWTNVQNEMLESFQAKSNEKKNTQIDQGLDQSLYFRMIKHHYALTSKIIEDSINDLDGLDKSEKQQIRFFTRQIINFFSPSNFLGTNQDALTEALETKGKSLVDGLENLVNDIESGDGDVSVSLTDETAFEVGENLAITEGKVIYRNYLFELIHYKPTTDSVTDIPLLIVPPWINKFYNLDLQPKNSFVRFAVSQGLPVFLISWVNPKGELSDVDFDAYVKDGFLEAASIVKQVTKKEQINSLGYCIGGTLLATALAYLSKKNDNFVKSATFLTTLTDFEDPGDLSLFVTDDYLDQIKQQIIDKGYMEGSYLAQTFSFLRSSDLVYGPAVRSYLMGKKPPRFDLLYWNGDATNLPGKMALQYLNNFYKDNLLSKGNLEVLGENLSLKDINVQIFVVATHTDHIAPWHSSFFGLNKTSGEKKFVLSGSGHIAGIINPAFSKKYGYWTNGFEFKNPNQWLNSAQQHNGSWWNTWSEWEKSLSGPSESLYIPGENTQYPSICLAPGKYVMENFK